MSANRTDIQLEGYRRRGIEELREIAREGAVSLADASATDVLEWAVNRFGTAWVAASSMQDAVLIHLVATVAPGVEVLFLDTGYHFPQTLATRERVARRYPVQIRSLRPEQTPAEQDAAYGVDLFATNPDLCCLLRKATPLFEALNQYEAWATGLRRVEASSRAITGTVGFDEAHGIVKLAPLAAWTDEQVESYARRHDVVRNPLLDRGFPSIGCAPCTRAVVAGADPRSGRWAGTDKTECGIHR